MASQSAALVHVGGEHLGLAALVLDQRLGLLGPLGVQVDEQHARPLPGQHDGRRLARCRRPGPGVDPAPVTIATLPSTASRRAPPSCAPPRRSSVTGSGGRRRPRSRRRWSPPRPRRPRTWRSPASPRSWRTASAVWPKAACSRPPESWPPQVLSGSSPSRPMRLPPSTKRRPRRRRRSPAPPATTRPRW